MASFWPQVCLHLQVYLLLHGAIGHVTLASPQNVLLSSDDFRIFLSWTSPSHDPADTEVYIRLPSTTRHSWLKLPNCSIPCDVTCEIETCYQPLEARVRGVSPQTNWTFAKPFEPFGDVVPSSPEVHVTMSRDFLTVDLHSKLSPCKRTVLQDCLSNNVKYKAELWQAGETFVRSILPGERIRISELSCHNCCILAKSILLEQKSKSSAPFCFEVKGKGFRIEEHIVIITVFVIIFTLIFAIAAIAWNRFYRLSKYQTPASLDFTKLIHFTPLMVNSQLEICHLATVCHWEQTLSRKGSLGRKATEQTNDWAPTESNGDGGDGGGGDDDDDDDDDDEDEESGYTDNRWIPDGMSFGEAETQDDTGHQTLDGGRHEQESGSRVLMAPDDDGQSQGTHLAELNGYQSKSYFAISNTSITPSPPSHPPILDKRVEFSFKRYDEQCKPAIFPLDRSQEHTIQVDVCFSSLQIL